jgi:hypothetical protein
MWKYNPLPYTPSWRNASLVKHRNNFIFFTSVLFPSLFICLIALTLLLAPAAVELAYKNKEFNYHHHHHLFSVFVLSCVVLLQLLFVFVLAL